MTMTLEDVLKGIKKRTWDTADELAVRQYSSILKESEKKGGSRYRLANLLNLSGFGMTMASLSLGTPALIAYYGIMTHVHGMDFVRTMFESRMSNQVTSDGTKVETSKMVSLYRKVAKAVRLPGLVSGLGFMGASAASLIDHIKTGNPSSLHDAMFQFSTGYGLFGVASSMYLKEADPKMLDKAPSWSEALDKAKRKLEDLTSPPPEPVRIPSDERY